MIYEDALKVLGDTVDAEGLFNLGHYIAYENGEEYVTLDDTFSLEELEAIVAYMKQHLKGA